MDVLTVKILSQLCQELIKNGNGEKKILISGDDEGNSYHELFYGFTPSSKMCFHESYNSMALPYGVSPEKAESDYIVLG